MAHDIDFSNERANIAYIKEKPWHGLGQELQPNQGIDVWAEAAGLSHEVKRAVTKYTTTDGVLRTFASREVLYRSDTMRALGVVGDNYHIVQPSEILDFFSHLAEHNGFTLETAGSLGGGKRIWALAKVNDGATVIGQDIVKPYVLLATSYDASMATTARRTLVRVVCQNTISYALAEGGDIIKIPHSQAFNAKDTRLDLGIAQDNFEAFLINARKLAKREVNDVFAVEFLKQLLPVTMSIKEGVERNTPVPVESTKAFKSIIALFDEGVGVDLPEARGTAWGLLNAVTEYTDHIAGRDKESRLASSWFGDGNAIKTRARDMLFEIVG